VALTAMQALSVGAAIVLSGFGATAAPALCS